MDYLVATAYCTPVAVQLKEQDLARTMHDGWSLGCFLSILTYLRSSGMECPLMFLKLEAIIRSILVDSPST
jgi:hypothetical protein